MNSEGYSLTLLKLVAVLGLVCLNGFFVAAEFAFVRLRRTQLDALVAKGHRRARIARRLATNLESCISTVQIGITLCGIATGALVKPVFEALLRPVFQTLAVESPAIRTTVEFSIGFLVSTFLLIVVGELVPKSLAIRNTLAVSLWTARWLEMFYYLTRPFIWILNRSRGWILGKLGVAASSESEHGHSEEELRLLVSTATSRSGETALSRNLVLNALDIRQRIVREVMRPRREITALDTRGSLTECIEIAEWSRYSRFPLCEDGDLDRTVGVVHIKDLYASRHKARTGGELRPVARRLIYVPETARLERVLGLFLERRLHLAIVVDEYGSTVGMVTLENLLEELVGQIQDEFDQEKPLFIQTSDQTWEVDGILPLHELSDLVGAPLREEGITTTSGLVTQRLGGFPKPGDTLTLGHYELRVEETDGQRVSKLQLTKRSPTQ